MCGGGVWGVWGGGGRVGGPKLASGLRGFKILGVRICNFYESATCTNLQTITEMLQQYICC